MSSVVPLVPMVLCAVEAEHEIFHLRFQSEADATRFRAFVDIYSCIQPVPRYFYRLSAPYTLTPLESFGASTTAHLRVDWLERMAVAILGARGVDVNINYQPPVAGRVQSEVSKEGGVITFEWPGLVP